MLFILKGKKKLRKKIFSLSNQTQPTQEKLKLEAIGYFMTQKETLLLIKISKENII